MKGWRQLQHRKPSTRNAILWMLKTEPGLNVSTMANRLGITEMAVRRHLSTLIKSNKVKSITVRQAIGRPIHRYYLTAAAEQDFPTSYSTLALELLEVIESESRDKVHQLFFKRIETMIQKYEPTMKDKNLEERIDELTRIQNKCGYMAEWYRNHDGKITFKEYNCPIGQIAKSYREVCDSELFLFQELLEVDVQRTACFVDNGRYCTYLIDANEKSLLKH